MNKKVIAISVLVILAFLIFYIVWQSQKKKKEMDRIRKKIQEGVGEQGKDIREEIYNVTPDSSFDAKAVASTIWGAKKPWYGNDCEDCVTNALRSLTKAQISAVNKAMLSDYGSDLETHLRKFDEDEYMTWLKMIQNAR